MFEFLFSPDGSFCCLFSSLLFLFLSFFALLITVVFKEKNATKPFAAVMVFLAAVSIFPIICTLSTKLPLLDNGEAARREGFMVALMLLTWFASVVFSVLVICSVVFNEKAAVEKKYQYKSFYCYLLVAYPLIISIIVIIIKFFHIAQYFRTGHF